MVLLPPLLLGLSLGCVGVGGFVAHVESTCLLDDNGTPKDFTYCIAFNKDLLACWDPEAGKIVPCEFGVLYKLAVLISDDLNENKALLWRLGNGLQDCAMNTKPFWNALTHRTRPPSVQVAQTAPLNTREPVMLACYVWGFYPADVTITWMKNGNFVMPHSIKESTSQTNGDWTYQTVSYLALTPTYGDIYTCVVQHSGTSEPVRQDWTIGLSPIQTVKVSVSAVTLGLGFIIFCLGLFHWRKSRFSSYVPLPGSTYPAGQH